MKGCAEVVPLLGPLLDAGLQEDDRAWVEAHLRGCAVCRDRKALLAAQAEALREVLRARGNAADFSGFADRVMARVAGGPLSQLSHDCGPRAIDRAIEYAMQIAGALAEIWTHRSDRYSELHSAGVAPSSERKVEMHYIGG